MTDPIEGSPAPAEPAPAEAPPAEATPADPPGLFRFSLEDRRAPALFAVGWLAVVAATGLAVVAILAGAPLAASILWVLGLLALAVGGVLLAGSQTVERAAAGRAYAGPSPVLVFVIVIAVAQLAGYVVGVPLVLAGVEVPRAAADLIAVVLQGVVYLLVVRLVIVAPGALRWSDLGIRGDSRAIASGFLGGALFAGPVILVTAIVAVAAVSVAGAVPPSPLPPTGTPVGLVLHLVAGAAIAPLYEELLFRGVAVTAWLRTAGARTAILRSSALFVLAHVLFVGGETFGSALAMAFVAGVVRIPIAIVLAWLFIRTGALWAPIGLHAAFNGILIALGELGPTVGPAASGR